MRYTIYCDLDGVLVNFIKGFDELTGEKLTEYRQFTSEDWAKVDKQGASYWANLDWTDDGRILWDYIKRYKPYILSSPSRSKSSRVGKDAWCRINIPNQYQKLYLYPRGEKQRFADKDGILIDDLEVTIKEWNAKGGIGILHTSANDTITKLKKIINE